VVSMKFTPPTCDRMGCRDTAVTAREIVERDGSRSFDALCGTHAAEYDLELSRLLELSAMHEHRPENG
jgi:hypothetical protein